MAGSSFMLLGLVGILVGVRFLGLGLFSRSLGFGLGFSRSLGFSGLSLVDRRVLRLDLVDGLLG